MDNKKIAIVIIVLVLIAGTGAFVFASGEGNFSEKDIDYSNNEPTYNKVDDEIKGQDVPIINNGETNNNNGNEIIDNNETSEGSNNNSSATSNQGSSQRNPSTSRPTGGTGTNPDQGGGTSTGSETGEPSNPTNPTPDNPEDNTDTSDQDETNNEEVEFKATLSYSYNDSTLTNQDIKITINANKKIENISDKNGNWVVLGNKAERTFKANAEGVVVVTNNGKEIPLAYTIDKIDKVKLTATVSYSETSKTYRPIEVTVKSDKEIEAVSETGWKYIDKYTIVKSYEENIDNTIIVEDEAKNQTEVNYKIENYDDSPKVVTSKNDEGTIVTITYKRPIEGIDNWQELDNGDWQTTITIEKNENGSIALPNGKTIEYEAAPNITILVSNQNSDGTFNKTNNPIEVIIKSDKELRELDGWTLTENKKELRKLETERKYDEKVTVYSVEGNSSIGKYTITNIDTVAPTIRPTASGIKATAIVNGYSTVTIKTDKAAIIADIDWVSKQNISFSKEYKEEDIKQGIVDYVEIADSYGNKRIICLKVYYDAGVKVEYESIN